MIPMRLSVNCLDEMDHVRIGSKAADLTQKPYVGSTFQNGLCARMSRSVVQCSLLVLIMLLPSPILVGEGAFANGSRECASDDSLRAR